MDRLHCDVLVIGAGGAGLRAAIEAAGAGATTLVVDQGPPGLSGATAGAASDWMAYGAAFGHRDPRDSPEQHALDIIVKGGLCLRPDLARRIAEDAPARLRDLESYGAEFDRAPDGGYIQVHSDGATYPRACGRGADTGPMMARALMAECGRRGVTFQRGMRLADLVLTPEGSVGGARFATTDRALVGVAARATVLATGGDGAVFLHNALPPGIRGAGYAAALRAGARLANMEFIQIGPCIAHPVKFALSGIFWRLRPRLTNGRGEEFLPGRMPAGVDLEAALHVKGHSFPFTVRNDSVYVDVAVFREIVEGRAGPHGGVWLDITHNDDSEIRRRAAAPLEHLMERGLDITATPLEFAPSVQHCNGGVLIGADGGTDIAGLFAAGEVAGGQHGADRPGGNALADTQTFGCIAGRSAARWSASTAARPAERLPAAPAAGPSAPLRAPSSLRRLAELLWRSCTIVREEAVLAGALAELDELAGATEEGGPAADLDLRDALLCARAHLLSARARTESRGTHFRADHPAARDDEWVTIQTVRLDGDGGMLLEREAPVIEGAAREAWEGSSERRADPVLPCW